MKKQIVFKMFLEKYDIENKLAGYLTNEEIKELRTIPPFAKIEKHKKSLIDSVHYSWFIPFLNLYSSQEASLFLSILNPSYKKTLQDLLALQEIEVKNPILLKFLKDFLLTSLIEKGESILPIECLSESKLNILLTLNKNQLVKLIDYLSFYDLVKEIKYIVEKEKLKKIYSYFNNEEKKFIKSILRYNEPFVTQKLNLIKYYSDKKKFRKILHTRGLMRLSFALSGESVDLIWYICHYLDIGRGRYIFRQCKKQKVAIISDVITSQILKIVNIFKEENI